MNTIRRVGRCRPALGMLVSLLLLCGGCTQQSPRPRVAGKVTFQGKAVAGQTLALYSEGSGSQFFSHKIPLSPEGTFESEVAAPGTYKVAIEESLAAQEGAKPSRKTMSLPAKYHDPANSGLSWTIQAGDNYREFALQE
jgi:hypothetical protein